MANTAHRPIFGISVSLVITATLSILQVGQLMSQSMSGSKSTKNGNVQTSYYDKYTDDCISAFGPPRQISVDATYKLSKITPFVRWDAAASAVEEGKVRDQIVTSFLNEKCTGYCTGWEWGGNPNLTFNLDRQFGAIELFRIDDSHVGHSGNFTSQDVTLFGPAKVQLVKQN